MSRQWMIDYDRPLSEQDREFLLSRAGHENLVRDNEERFSGEDAEEDPGATVEDQIKALGDKELDKALRERDLSTQGKKKDKQKRLLEYVEANEAGDEDDEDDAKDAGQPAT